MHRLIYFICFLLLFSCGNKKSTKSEPKPENPIQLRVGAYNVEVSRNATALEIGEALKPYEFDVVSFSEAPGGDWTTQVASVLGMKHVTVGQYSTAGHEDKYKTIASKTPLYGVEEILMADTLHTVTKAMTKIGEREIGLYSVHFPCGWRDQAHIDETTWKVTTFVDYLKGISEAEEPIVMGDFNFRPSNSEIVNNYHEMFVQLGLNVHWKELGIDPTKENTYNALKPEDEGNGEVIDHIMYNNQNFRAIEGGILPMKNPLSDHKAVWTVLEFK